MLLKASNIIAFASSSVKKVVEKNFFNSSLLTSASGVNNVCYPWFLLCDVYLYSLKALINDFCNFLSFVNNGAII